MIGKHPTWIEGDVLVCKVRGPYTLDEIKEYLRLAEQIIAAQGHCFLLSDIGQMSGAPLETRRWAADWFRTHTISGGAMFGNSLPARTVLSLLARAVGLISGSALPLVFLKTEDEALAWIATRRKSVLSVPASSPASPR